MTKKAVIFDLDGTLWDSSRQITDSWNEVLEKQGRKACTYEFISSLLGQPMDAIAMAVYPDLSLDEAMEKLNECMDYENAYLAKHGAMLYPDLRSTLEELRRNYFTAIVSNSQSGYIEAFLKAHDLSDLFDDFECFGNTMEYKDANIRNVLKRNQIDEAFYVGDIQSDCDASFKAGIPFVFASYGFGDVRNTPQISGLNELKTLAPVMFEEIEREQQ